jgi:hypothetical protein
MSLTAVLFSSHFLMALVVYALAIIAVELLVNKLHTVVSDVDVTAWMIEQVVLPLARAAALALFLFAAYPVLFGIETAPALGSILFFKEGRFSALVNLAFILSLLLPLLPLIGKQRAVILPLQGIAIAALLFHWTASALGISHGYWPGGFNLLLIILLIGIAAPLAHRITHWFGRGANQWTERTGFEVLAFEGLLLFFQAPAILIYTLSLGAQLKI